MKGKNKNFLNFIKDEVKGINGYAVAGMMAISLSLFAFKNNEKQDLHKFQVNSLTELSGGRVQINGTEITGQQEGIDYNCNAASLNPPCTVEGTIESTSGPSTYVMESGYQRINGDFEQ